MTCFRNTKDPKISEQKRYKRALTRDGLIIYDKEIPATIRFNHDETRKLLKKSINFDKLDHHCEVAHLEISNKCNLGCSYCYVPNKNGKELPAKAWKIIIDNLAKAGVFQMSFGGGEPTLRKDLFKLAKFAEDAGLNLGMTTNGSELIHLNPKKLKKYFRQINVSWHGNPEVFEEALMFLQEHDIPAGINYTYMKNYVEHNDMIKFIAEEYNAELLYLVYKPVIKDKRKQISGAEVYKVAKQAANEGLRVAVDGPCVDQCLMKKKFIDVDHMGNVYPCSFVRKPLGNLLKQSMQKIWENRGEQEECPFVKFGKEK